MDSIKIDWSKPIEAVHVDGRVLAAEYAPNGSADENRYYVSCGTTFGWPFYETGLAVAPTETLKGFHIRNVAPKEVEWGPEIKVEGKRPEWLGSEDQWQCTGDIASEWYDANFGPASYNWDGRDFSFIRLPANHPHYATPTRTALEQRMEDLVRRMAGNSSIGEPYEEGRGATYSSAHYIEARAILAELEPVDGDLLEARELVANSVPTWNDSHRRDCREGAFDSNLFVTIAHSALRRGRALERGE